MTAQSIESLYELYRSNPIITTDTRKIEAGALFFALKGDNFDGNKFAEQALEAGAAYAVVDDSTIAKDDRFVLVDDVLKALQELARHHRHQLSIPVIGITGTNGKTTTKELINAVLSAGKKSFATKGNLNNHIGVPLTLLAIPADTEIAIIEMGANHQKEIESLSTIAQPTHGLITNVGKAHLEGFGGFEGVKKGKGELYQYLSANGGTVFINKDNDHLLEMAELQHLDNIIYYGTGSNTHFSGRLLESDPYLLVGWHEINSDGPGNETQVQTQLTGKYNLENVLAAVAIGTHFGLSPDQIKAGIEGYSPNNNRSQITKTASNTLICDYYNANPSSMAVALENFKSVKAANKVMILGDMFELGDESIAEHEQLIRNAAHVDAKCYFVGKVLCSLGDDASGTYFESTEAATSYFQQNPVKDSTVLIKGSRGMALEKLVELF